MAKSEKISGRVIEGEYWSNEALEEKPVEELYPQLEGEPDETYEKRIGEIASIMSDDDSIPLSSSAGEAVGISDDAIRKRISKKIGNAPFRHILDPALVHKDDNEFGLEAQKTREEKAEKYRKTVENMTTAPVDFIGLEGFDERKISSDQRYVESKEMEIASKKLFLTPEQSEIEDQAEKREKTIEALFYPMIINYGLLDDSEGRRGQVFYPSRYDDLVHGVDVGLALPILFQDKTGKTHRGFEMITLDCTVAESVSGMSKKLNHTSDDGLTEFDYAKNESGELVRPGKVPNFTVGISRTMIDAALTKDNLEHTAQALRLQLLQQIRMQADLRMQYLATYRTNPRPDNEPLTAKYFKSEADINAFRTMLRIKRSMDSALQGRKIITSKQTQNLQEAITIKSNKYKEAI